MRPLATLLFLVTLGGCPDTTLAPQHMRLYQESYGMCMSYCELSVDFSQNGELTLTVDDIVNTGELTEAGRVALALSPLPGDTRVEPNYGCPDCNDGGEALIELSHGDDPATQHVFEAGDPPPVLEAMGELGREVMMALKYCTSTDTVSVHDDCEAIP